MSESNDPRWEALKRLGALKEHVVQYGDNLSRLAANAGLKSWREIYYHPYNAHLRSGDRSPNIIRPGEVIAIPMPS